MITFLKSLFLGPSKVPRIILVIAMAIYFAFGLFHLGKFISFDEHFWLYNPESDRIHQYWQAIGTGDWEDTRINDKPGITLAWTSGIALLFEGDAASQVKFTDGNLKIFDPAKIERVNILYRLPILIISGLSAFYFFWILKKLLESEWLALWSTLLTLLSPILIGMSQIVNPDSLFWIFGAATIFTFLAFLKQGGKKLGLLTTLAFGLAMASKYVAIIFIPFFFLATLAWYLFAFDQYQANLERFARRVLRNALAYLGMIAGGIAIFSIMMPAVFVRPEWLYRGTIGFPGMEPIFWSVMILNALVYADARLMKSRVLIYLLQKLQFLKVWLPRVVAGVLLGLFTFVLINWMFRHRLLDLSNIPYDMKRKDGFDDLPYLHRLLLEVVPMVFGLTPIVVLSLLYLWAKTLIGKVTRPFLVFIVSVFFLVFYVAVIEQGLLVTIRYSIVLFPLATLLAAIACEEFFFVPQPLKENGVVKPSRHVMLFSLIAALAAAFFTIMAVEQKRIMEETAMQRFYDLHRVWSFVIVIGGSVALTWVVYRILSWIRKQNISRTWVSVGLIVASLPSLLAIAPFYFSYSSDMLPKKYTITGTWGYGGYEAAQYLNSLPNAENLLVWSDSYGVCEFFVGKCMRKQKVKLDRYKIDYYVRMSKPQLSPNFSHPMERDTSWDIAIDGRYKNFVKVYKAADANKPAAEQDDWGL